MDKGALRYHAGTYRNNSQRPPASRSDSDHKQGTEERTGQHETQNKTRTLLLHGESKQILSYTIKTEQVVEVNHVPNVRFHAYKDYMLEERMRSPSRQCNSADYHEQTEFDSDPTHIGCHAGDCQLSATDKLGAVQSYCDLLLWMMMVMWL